MLFFETAECQIDLYLIFEYQYVSSMYLIDKGTIAPV